ncbi:MAG: hypothetical protein IKT27_01645 [Clostridia bacterium]|nr:hypothetical protein [Clostridia bacterium]
MDKFYKNFQIARIILWILVAVFVVLRIFVAEIFTSFAVVTGAIAFIMLGITCVFRYVDLKRSIEEGFDTYLAEQLKDGFITKQQFTERDPSLYKEYKRLYTSEKWMKILGFLACFAVAVFLIIWVL